LKTLLIDGQWMLKKNFHKRRNMSAYGVQCGGVFGFLDSLRLILQKTLPDRVVVMWDGFNSGKLRYDIYKPYKSNRNKKWEDESRAVELNGTESEKDKEDFDFFQQKLKTQSYLEELYVRQLEIEFIEADDLIAQYIIENPNEEILIHSRDRDYLQLVSENVSVLTPDKLVKITQENFVEQVGYTQENALLIKCFEGDSSDCIKGVNGVNFNKLQENFPSIINKKYTYKQLVEECYESKKTSKKKIYDKIIESSDILYRNAQLMNLKKPFVSDIAIQEVKNISHGTLGNDRNIGVAMSKFSKDGYIEFINGPDYISYFFSPFYRIKSKEFEFSQKK